ncbi:MAG: 1-deoxy-D-xylulose-5-phosphate synthase [Cellulomonadaceae bacterium]|nr:1-deoxy-D-xylulose-5-phosphate synthase [Cellulomonadaceae bacterium]
MPEEQVTAHVTEPILPRITIPSELTRLSAGECTALAQEIREFLIENVSKTGGHLGPNLGVVETTIAMHRVFDSPRDTFVFDTGHQSYVHKLLTGRQDFSALRKKGGLSGYPNRAESVHDAVENSHASAALSWADGISKANELTGKADRYTVVLVGDGSLTGGMAWEALNNIAQVERPLVIVVNDNGRSYSPTIGALATHLDVIRTNREYEKILSWGERTLLRMGRPGNFVFRWLRGLRKGLKKVAYPQGLFEDLGIKYLGPVNGHDVIAVEHALERAKQFRAPIIVHVHTEKGRGYAPAENDAADRFHAVGAYHPETGLPVVTSRFGWTAVFADEIVTLAREREDIVGITAAMLHPVGLAPFQEEFPQRCIDVGIAEQHAVAAAAGLAYGGLHPVVALYATFLNRAFDQVLMDVADAPTVVRYPKGELPEPIPALSSAGGVDVIYDSEGFGSEGFDRRSPSDQAQPSESQGVRVLLVGLGSMAPVAGEVAQQLRTEGIAVTVAAPTWILPVPAGLVELTRNYQLIVTVEDGLVDGGAGEALAHAMADAAIATPVRMLGLPDEFLAHASREQIAEERGLTAEGIAATVRTAMAH